MDAQRSLESITKTSSVDNSHVSSKEKTETLLSPQGRDLSSTLAASDWDDLDGEMDFSKPFLDNVLEDQPESDHVVEKDTSDSNYVPAVQSFIRSDYASIASRFDFFLLYLPF